MLIIGLLNRGFAKFYEKSNDKSRRMATLCYIFNSIRLAPK